MIRKNESLGCCCANPEKCPNGPNYADYKDVSGNPRCITKHRFGASMRREILENPMNSSPCEGKVKDSIRNRVKALETEYELNTEIRIATKRVYPTREEILLREEEKRDYSAAKAGTCNDKEKIRRNIEMKEYFQELKKIWIHKKQLKQMVNGITPLVFGFPGKLSIFNDLLAYEYRRASIKNQITMLRVNPGVVNIIEKREKEVIESEWYVLPNPHRHDTPRCALWAKK